MMWGTTGAAFKASTVQTNQGALSQPVAILVIDQLFRCSRTAVRLLEIGKRSRLLLVTAQFDEVHPCKKSNIKGEEKQN